MEENSQKEINFFVLIQMFFKWLKKIFIKFFQLIGELFRLLYRHKILTIAFFIISVAIGAYLGRSSAKKYNVEGMAIINGANSQAVKEISRKIEWASSLDENTSLQNLLNIPDSVARSISRIESFYVIDYLNDSTPDFVDIKGKHPLDDTLNVRMPNRLYYKFRTKKISQLPVFEEAFLNYFNTHPLLVKEYEFKKNTLEEKLRTTDKELVRLDSLASITYLRDRDESLGNFNGILYGEQKKQLLYKDLWRVYNYKMKFESEYATFTAPMVLPAGFNAIPKPVRGRISYIIISGLIGLGILTLLCLFIENRKRISNYLSSKK